MFLAAREGSCEAVKVLLAHFANREITDHMDRLPRDIAQDRMHHDIVQLLDEYNTVRSPQGHAAASAAAHHLVAAAAAAGHTLSPLMCPPSSFLPGLKTTPQGKKNRRPGAKGSGGLGGGQHGGMGLKDSAKVRNKKLTLDMQSALLESSVTLSPVDSLDSPHGGASNAGYMTNPTSPAAMPSPGLFHSSMSVPSTPMVHPGLPDGGGPFAISLAQLNELGAAGGSDPGLSMHGRISMAQANAAHGYVLSTGQLGMGMGMVNPVSVPFDWHSRMPPSSQCGPVLSMVHPATSQAGLMPQTPSGMPQGGLLMHQQMFRAAAVGQPMLQPTPICSTPTISPVKLASIAEQQQQQPTPQQLHSHALARMGNSTPPTPQQAQPPPPAFYQPTPQQPQQVVPQPSQAAAAAVAAASAAAAAAAAVAAVQPPQPQASQPGGSGGSSSSGTGLEDYPTPPSQHSYTSAMDATPKHYLHLPSEHPYLTPSPESPEPWSSPSPQCVSDWSESTPSPAVSGPAQTQIPHVSESNGKMQVFA